MIYNAEIPLPVPGKISGKPLPDLAVHSPAQENPPLSAMDILFYIRPACFSASFFFLIITDLIRKHPVIEKAAAADCFLYLNALLFIWIDPYFYGAVHFSHPGFLYTAVLFQSAPRLHGADRSFSSLLLALLQALMNLRSSVFGCARNST